MKTRRIAAVVAALALAGAAPTAGVQASTSGPTAYAACTKAKIGGASKCIARGQYCARSHQRDYKRYGFSCSKRDYNGRYHLR
jgi:curli biogenesis system outer membrane secretion channel CsgG